MHSRVFGPKFHKTLGKYHKFCYYLHKLSPKNCHNYMFVSKSKEEIEGVRFSFSFNEVYCGGREKENTVNMESIQRK